MPVAPWMPWPTSGDVTARRAASRPRLGPLAMPMPISADPASRMIVRTSAKSRLIRPGVVIRSQTPWTPWRRMSSATRKASTIDVRRSSTVSSRSFGIVTSVSTLRESLMMPSSAWAARRAPSKPNGVVTMPTVSAPSSRAMRATTGAAPVPVPPPSPAATNTRSEPRRASRIVGVRLLGGLAADLRIGARAETLGEHRADVDLHGGVGERELLRVGVDREELDAADAGLDHPVDRVDAGATDADDADHGQVGGGLRARGERHGPGRRTRRGDVLDDGRGAACRTSSAPRPRRSAREPNHATNRSGGTGRPADRRAC